MTAGFVSVSALPEGLARATAAACRAVLGQLPNPRVVVVRVRDGGMPWSAVLLDAAYFPTAAIPGEPDAAIERALVAAYHGEPGVCRLDVVAHADPVTRKQMKRHELSFDRELSLGPAEQQQVQQVRRDWETRAFEAALRLLNGPKGLSPVPVVFWANWKSSRTRAYRSEREQTDRLPEGVRDSARWAWTIDTAGLEVVRRIWSELDRNELAPRRPIGQVRDRQELVETATAAGLGRVADVIADDALIAAGIRPAAARSGRSRIGGRIALSAGTPWPEQDGGPLALLAAIDCAELPTTLDERALLPAAGTLCLFAKVEDQSAQERWHFDETEDGHAVLLIDESPKLQGGIAAGAAPPLLPETPVELASIVTVRESWAARERYRLTTAEAVAYTHLLEATRAQEPQLLGQVLGHPDPLNDDPREPDQHLLMQLRSTAAELISPAFGGSLYLLGSADTLRNERWDEVFLAVD